jgi:hypothetical protein
MYKPMLAAALGKKNITGIICEEGWQFPILQ